MVQFSSDILHKLVAPRITEFTRADIPDLRTSFPQAEHWLANHFLNSLTGHFQAGTRQIALGFLRRAQHAFRAYHDARSLTFQYLTTANPFEPNVRRLYDALVRWEEFALQASMGMELFRWLNGGIGAFTKNDDSKEYRLYTLANHVKHLSKCVDSGQCAVDDTVPLWLTNDGLASFGITVSYVETAEIVADLARLADQLQNPKGFVDSRRGQVLFFL